MVTDNSDTKFKNKSADQAHSATADVNAAQAVADAVQAREKLSQHDEQKQQKVKQAEEKVAAEEIARQQRKRAEAEQEAAQQKSAAKDPAAEEADEKADGPGLTAGTDSKFT
ncbi:MAG: hypothetical protein ACQEQL_08950, partial [Pseudomonadota bacterium]